MILDRYWFPRLTNWYKSNAIPADDHQVCAKGAIACVQEGRSSDSPRSRCACTDHARVGADPGTSGAAAECGAASGTGRRHAHPVPRCRGRVDRHRSRRRDSRASWSSSIATVVPIPRSSERPGPERPPEFSPPSSAGRHPQGAFAKHWPLVASISAAPWHRGCSERNRVREKRRRLLRRHPSRWWPVHRAGRCRSTSSALRARSCSMSVANRERTRKRRSGRHHRLRSRWSISTSGRVRLGATRSRRGSSSRSSM